MWERESEERGRGKTWRSRRGSEEEEGAEKGERQRRGDEGPEAAGTAGPPAKASRGLCRRPWRGKTFLLGRREGQGSLRTYRKVQDKDPTRAAVQVSRPFSLRPPDPWQAAGELRGAGKLLHCWLPWHSLNARATLKGPSPKFLQPGAEGPQTQASPPSTAPGPPVPGLDEAPEALPAVSPCRCVPR